MGNPQKFAQGRSVAELLHNHRIPANIATYILIECAKALKEAYEQGKLHLNIKPAHILISSSGNIRVTKFSAESGQAPLLKSALPYVAPERLSGASPSVSSDIFALGSSFFEILTGDLAFKGGTGQEIKQKVLNYDPTPLLHEEDLVHTQLRRICQQMLRKKPQQRYQGYKVLLADLEAYKKNRGIEAVGSAAELKRFMNNPDGYVSPEKNKSNEIRTGSRATRSASKAPDAKSKEAKSKDGEPKLSRMFFTVGIIVLLFSGLSIAGNFFFSKDGKWGGSGASPGARTSSSERSSTVTTRRGRGQGNAAVQASSSSDAPQSAGVATVSGQSDPVEVVDKSGEEPVSDNEERALQAVSLAGVDTVIILPNDSNTPEGRLLVKSSPPAYVFFQGDSLGKTPLPIITHPGTYKIELRAQGFPAFETVADVLPDRETPVDVSLWILVGRLDLTLNPAADVFVNDVLVGRSISQKAIPVRSGKHRLKVIHQEYGTFESEFDITAGENISRRFDLADMR